MDKLSVFGLLIGLLALVGVMAERGAAWFVGLLVAAVIALYHYTLIRARERGACFKAFRHNNWLGAAVFAGLLVDDLLRSV